jgi:hypothetical protein
MQRWPLAAFRDGVIFGRELRFFANGTLRRVTPGGMSAFVKLRKVLNGVRFMPPPASG